MKLRCARYSRYPRFRLANEQLRGVVRPACLRLVLRIEDDHDHHLRLLRAAGVVRSRRDGKMVMYGLTEEGEALLEAVLAAEGALRG